MTTTQIEILIFALVMTGCAGFLAFIWIRNRPRPEPEVKPYDGPTILVRAITHEAAAMWAEVNRIPAQRWRFLYAHTQLMGRRDVILGNGHGWELHRNADRITEHLRVIEAVGGAITHYRGEALR